MINNVFYFVLNMSIIAAFIVIILLIIRAIFGRWIQKSLIYSLWGIVLFRLMIPLSVSSRFSLINFINPYVTKSVTIPKVHNIMTDLPAATTTNSIQLAKNYFPIEYKSSMIEVFFNASSIIWLIGMFLFIGVTIIVYIMTTARLNTATLIHNNKDILKICKNRLRIKGDIRVFESGFINTPIVMGILKPRIIIPKGTSVQELEYVLLHELSHIKRRDNVWKLLSIFAVCIHWFNPFAWLFLYISENDMELACDAHVLENIQYNKRKNYAMTLAKLAEKQRMPFTALGSTAVKERIINIINYRRIPIAMIAATSVLCIIITILLITNPII